MRGWGVTFVIIGIGAFILPFFGYQFKLISIFGSASPVVAIVVAIIGVVLVVVGGKKGDA